jgi:hypothetical protein
MKVLFILHEKIEYNTYSKVSSGLFNSASFVVDMLNRNNIDTKIVEVVDNNSIDKEVTLFKPDICIIEALWVVPEKFEILHKLHPHVKWIIRIHSHIPFLASEGIAVEWIRNYGNYPNIFVSANNIDTVSALTVIDKNIIYLPNYYPVKKWRHNRFTYYDNILDIGCFGAIRPMKNQLIQAMSAIKLADDWGCTLRFHINGSRVENQGDPVLKNLKYLFKGTKHELVEHGWYTHKEFLGIIKTMDLCLQVSLTETYNIVTADCINENVSVVVSGEIDFVASNAVANPKDSDSILRAMKEVLSNTKYYTNYNKFLLSLNSNKSEGIWIKKLNKI